MKYAWIGKNKAAWPVTVTCEVLGVSTSGYFEHQRRRQTRQPVSYTHLDVYKRQLRICSFQLLRRPQVLRRREPVAQEIERKFVINPAAWVPRDGGIHFRQGYLNSQKERVVRAVSYTHLDVYKRQPPGSMRR